MRLRDLLAALLMTGVLALSLMGCAATDIPPKGPTGQAGQPTDPTQPAPTPVPTFTVTGSIKEIAASAKVISLTETIEGFDSVAVTDKTVFVSKDESVKSLADLKPGSQIEAVGQASGSSAILADTIRIIAGPSSAPAGDGKWDRVQLKDVSLSIDAPAGWRRLGTEYAWASPASQDQRVGVNWMKREPGVEPTSLLPNHSVSMDAVPLDASWGTGMKHTVQVSAPDASGGATVAVEMHAIILTDNYVYDFYASAPDPQQLDELWTIVNHMINSVK